MRVVQRGLFLIGLFCFCNYQLFAQCAGQVMEPGFAFITSSRGCAPFQIEIQTLYLQSSPGTQYFVDWGDGSPEEVYNQTAPYPNGPIITHLYPNSPTDCGYDIVIEVDNPCNPRGSVVLNPIPVIVWTNDITSINPAVFRVCQGFATNLNFVDDSDWNCFPRADTRENDVARWIRWEYGTGPAANRIPGITVDGIIPGAYPYFDPMFGVNPEYPVGGPGDVSLGIGVPVTVPADIGKEFEVTLSNWNQCNPYDNDVNDGALNPIAGPPMGDNAPIVSRARVVIVDSPVPAYQTLDGPGGNPQTTFCIGDDIYFDNQTPAIAGANFGYTWEFYDGNTDASPLVFTSNDENPTYAYATGGSKLIRLIVRDKNAAGNCRASYEDKIIITPTLIAQIGITDLSNNLISGEFCQDPVTPQNLDVRFVDISTGVANANTRWRWEFYDENNVLIRYEPGPANTDFSATSLGPFDEVFTNVGRYRARLIVLDQSTTCESEDEVEIFVYENPQANFSATQVCAGDSTTFLDMSTLNAINGENIVSWEWDFNYDGVTFNKEALFDNQTDFKRVYPAGGSYDVALRVTSNSPVSCNDIFVQTVIVDPLPVATVSPDQTSGCSILTVNFDNTSIASQTTAIQNYIWEVDEGGGFIVDSVQSPMDAGFTNIYTKNFKNVGTTDKVFRVRLRVVSTQGCETVSVPIDITVFPGPISGFSSLNYSPFDDNCSPVSVDFEVDAVTQSLSPSDYTWRIEDDNGLVNQVSTGTTPNFTYNFVNDTESVKDFEVTLTSTLPTGCFGDSTRTIRVSPVPVADFTIDTLAFDCDNMRILVEASRQGYNNYEWEVRQNGVVTLASSSIGSSFELPFDLLASDLPVDITLRTTNFADCESELGTGGIVIPAKKNINAAFNVTPLEQSLPDATVFFENLTSAGPWTYEWDFGDGNTSDDPNIASHTYTTFGTYTITLSVSDQECVETAVQTITINPVPPVVDFTYDPGAGCPPLTVQFTNLSQFADPSSYFWEFGANQGTSRAEDPQYTYFEAGTYTVSLSAANILGDTVREVKTMIIEVYEKPVALFDIRPFIVFIPDNPIFTDNNSFSASSYFWDFGDGTTSTDPEPTHTYEELGVFDVTLIASNEFGCTDTLTRESIVETRVGGRVLVPNAFTPNLSGPIGGAAGRGGTNDVFLPVMEGVSEFEMQVFNRWGELLFETRNKNIGWDGYYQGKLSPQDVYIYKLSVVFQNGESTVRTGDINLIR